MQKAYTVQEVDDLRRCCESKYLYGSYKRPYNVFSRSYSEADKIRAVEDMVRTHMLAGHTSSDLIASDKGTV